MRAHQRKKYNQRYRPEEIRTSATDLGWRFITSKARHRNILCAHREGVLEVPQAIDRRRYVDQRHIQRVVC